MHEAIPQMTRIGDIEDALDAMNDRLSKLDNQHSLIGEHGSLSEADNSISYGIGQSDRAENAIDIPLWVDSHSHDPAVKVCTLSCG